MLRKFVSYDKGFTHKECLQINKEQKCYNKTKGLIDIDNRMTVTRGGRGERVKGVKHMVMHGVEDTDVVLQSGTLEIYVTSVTPICLIIKN